MKSATVPTTELVEADCLEWLRARPTDSVDFVFGSPPYAGKGERYDELPTCSEPRDWVEWMADVTEQAVRVSSGYVLWVVNGFVRKGYHPACEGLVWAMYNRDERLCERPCIWHKNAPPSRNGKWFSNDWEFVLAFHKPDIKPYFNWQAIATPMKSKTGGSFDQRGRNGKRRRGSDYPQGDLAQPRDVVRCLVGGGHMGSKLAHLSEAPFPESLATHFLQACCPPGGTVLDPFTGSSTTLAAAAKLGMNGIGVDCRQSQIELSRQRLAEIQPSDLPIST
jgi:site-specific DNA-methyltransferase (cytosine-N4-specific)